MLPFRYVFQMDLRGVAVQGQQLKWHLWRDSAIIGRRLRFHCPPPRHTCRKDVRSNNISRWGQLEPDPPDAREGTTLGGLSEEWALTLPERVVFTGNPILATGGIQSVCLHRHIK